MKIYLFNIFFFVGLCSTEYHNAINSEIEKHCECPQKLGCFLINNIATNVTTGIQCTKRDDIVFLHTGACSNQQILCDTKPIERFYNWCPFIMRCVYNFYAYTFNVITFDKWHINLLNYKYYIYQTPLGENYKVDTLYDPEYLRTCGLDGCQSLSCINKSTCDGKIQFQKDEIDDFLSEYVPQGTLEDEETLLYLIEHMETISLNHKHEGEKLRFQWTQLESLLYLQKKRREYHPDDD